MKLKTVSMLTMLFALLCVAAFVAGRPPLSAGNEAAELPMFLGLRTATYHVRNIGEANLWYSRVLGVEPYFDKPFYVGFRVRGYELGLVPANSGKVRRAPAGVAYWGVEDAHATYQRLIDLGATPEEPVQDVGGGILIGSVHDPFGNVLGIVQNPHFKIE